MGLDLNTLRTQVIEGQWEVVGNELIADLNPAVGFTAANHASATHALVQAKTAAVNMAMYATTTASATIGFTLNVGDPPYPLPLGVGLSGVTFYSATGGVYAEFIRPR